MKKIICITLVLLVSLGCLTACFFTQNMSGNLPGKAEATQKVEEMMSVLADDNISDAKALLHPQAAEASEDALAQMSTYLAGRKASSVDLENISINTSVGVSGKTRQERAAYRVTLTDGVVIYLNSIYLSDHKGSGFSSFQLVLGVV